jgi:tetratricopeptide (TPR) repeat protein
MSWTFTSSTNRAGFSLASLTLGVALASVAATGCSDVRGRKLIQDGNDLYKRGQYADAVAVYEEAEALVPELPTLWLNLGYTCRQLVVPGAKDADTQRAVACALAAFKRLAELRPSDARADQLTIETMFDADDLRGLEVLFLERNRRAPEDVDVVRGLQQVYYKWGKWPQALNWSKRAAALRPNDAEAQYGVGTFVWQILSAKGGGAEMAGYDPRPRLPDPDAEIAGGPSNVRDKVGPSPKSPTGAKSAKSAKSAMSAADVAARPVAPPAPATAANDISGPLRAELADEGIRYLQRALELRPRYPEAMTYLALLFRQKSFAFFGDVPQWQAAVDQSNAWQKRANVASTGKS